MSAWIMHHHAVEPNAIAPAFVQGLAGPSTPALDAS
jgi:hypothetical protein